MNLFNKKNISTNTFIEKLKEIKVIPVVKVNDTNDAINIASSLLKADCNIIEITYRTSNASECIKKVSSTFLNMIVGAGTVTNLSQAKDAIKNGAKFIVLPGIEKNVIKYCLRKKIFVIPGVSTPTEIITCINLKINLLKLFPCNMLGGINILKTYSAPFKNVTFIPTGGINAQNVSEYLEQNNVTCVAGSWITDSKLIKNKDFEKIYQNALQIKDL